MPDGIERQPVAGVQWLHRDMLSANDYNPNVVAPREFRLLIRSILEDGWTQPIVSRETPDGRYEIVDGFHRWRASDDKRVRKMTDGFVPVVVLPPIRDRADRILSTIRHNRARGVHVVDAMSGITAELIEQHGLQPRDLMRRLGMEREEIERLYDNSGMPLRGSAAHEQFSQAWEPDDG